MRLTLTRKGTITDADGVGGGAGVKRCVALRATDISSNVTSESTFDTIKTRRLSCRYGTGHQV